MGTFTATVRKEYKFDGDDIVVTMKRIKRTDMMSLMKFRPKGNAKTIAKEVSADMLDAFAAMLPEYVVSITGGPDIETVCEQSFYLGLLGQIGGDLTASGTVSEEDSGNSGKPAGK